MSRQVGDSEARFMFSAAPSIIEDMEVLIELRKEIEEYIWKKI